MRDTVGGAVGAPVRRGRERATWMDVTRGAAILLVLFHHANEASRIYGDGSPDLLLQINDALGPYRMPTLVFLSGMLLPRSLDKGAGPFFLGKLRGIAWPFLVWSTLTMWVTDHLTTRLLVRNLWFPTTVLWFLWFLLAFYAVAYVLTLLRVPVLLVAGASLVASASATDDYRLDRFLFLLPFFLLGLVVSTHREAVERALHRWWVLVLGGLATVATAALGLHGVPVRFEATYAWGVLGVLVLVVGLVPRLDRGGPASRTLRYVGRSSLVFYCLHWPAIALTWQGLLALGVDANRYLVPASLLSGGAAGLGMSVLAARSRAVDALFRLPARRSTGVPGDAAPRHEVHVPELDEGERPAGAVPPPEAAPGGVDARARAAAQARSTR